MPEPLFHTSRHALAVLRRGKKDANWFAAAEYLIERASPEVELMLEVGRELERRDQKALKAKQKAPTKPWLKWLLLGLAVMSVGAGLGWFLTQLFGIRC